MNKSTKYTLTKTDMTKVLVGALIAIGGAFLTYLASAITQIDFGVYTPVVVALSSILINAAKKFLEGK
jgi:hypothetical protein